MAREVMKSIIDIQMEFTYSIIPCIGEEDDLVVF